MSGVNKKGIVALVVSLGVITLLFIPTDEQVSQTVTTEVISVDGITTTEVISVDGIISADDLDLQFAIDDLIAQSIIDTDVSFKDSDDTFVEQIVDNLGLGEKFGIVTTVSLVDSNNNIKTETNVFGVALPTNLSVTDESGNVLDFGGSIQVIFDSVLPSGTVGTSWATVNFFLDDDRIKSSKLWASHIDENRETMILVDSLAIVNHKPVPPAFSNRGNDNFTFTFTDENLSDGTHTFRVVLTDVDAVIGENRYVFAGENIVYELDFDVDNNKVTKIAEDGNDEKIIVYKSDSAFIIESASSQRCGTANGNTVCHSVSAPDMPPIPNVKVTIDGFSHTVTSLDSFSGGSFCNLANKCTASLGTFSLSTTDKIVINFPRNSHLQVEINGVIYVDEVTPLSQKNYEIKCYPVKLSETKSERGHPPYRFIDSVTWQDKCFSSFDYSETLGESYKTFA